MASGTAELSNPPPATAGDRAPAAADLDSLRVLARVSPVAIFRADREGRCTYVNQRWCEMTGRAAAEVLGDGWHNVLHPEDRVTVCEQWQRMVAEDALFQCEYRYLPPAGGAIWVFGQATAERDASGEVLGYIGAATDISGMRSVRAGLEDGMRQRAAQLVQMERIVHCSGEAIVSSDFAGTIVSWNRAAERIFGFSAAEMIGSTTYPLTPAHLMDEAAELKRRLRAGEQIEDWETVRRTRGGRLVEVSLSGFPLRDRDGEVVGTCAIVRDITPRKKAEHQLRQLSWRLMQMQDEERRRIARELHDTTAQTVAALEINLSVLEQAWHVLPEPKRARLLADSLGLSEQATRELRTTSYLLHPPLLAEGGLGCALQWYVEGFAARSGIAMDLEFDPAVRRLPPETETTIFRVVQESLSNVHRHSQSPSARISLTQDARWVTLEIADQGRGLPAMAGESLSVGICGMRERLAQLGGALEVDSDGNGTKVVARFPAAYEDTESSHANPAGR